MLSLVVPMIKSHITVGTMELEVARVRSYFRRTLSVPAGHGCSSSLFVNADADCLRATGQPSHCLSFISVATACQGGPASRGQVIAAREALAQLSCPISFKKPLQGRPESKLVSL